MEPHRSSFVSTSVAAKLLGLDAAVVRAMIEAGSLPEPQWLNLGRRLERIYSLEWLRLASESVDLQRLQGLELGFDPAHSVEFVLRFAKPDWTLPEIADRLAAIDDLWIVCAAALDREEGHVPSLNVRRLSAGSPLDVFVWVGEQWGALGTGAVAALLLYVLKNPEKVSEAIPRMVAGWREQWARADDARIAQITARENRRAFERDAGQILRRMNSRPTGSALSGLGTSNLELTSPDPAIPAITPNVGEQGMTTGETETSETPE
ncbi:MULTISPECIES: hypothetical protein [Plantibacter]|uniref:hypothetical protein n=1 Tax=Plantibacter TaxID=190323 RepID=UPI0010C21DA7|nr:MULTISPECIES: hypothetical protein [Plantibacter]MBD8103862.1 hypothetical protein [Plantibacter sp. CFBP 8775]MBD8467310.1 hypothetical protein [Plantibacter sp. CFBP 8798]